MCRPNTLLIGLAVVVAVAVRPGQTGAYERYSGCRSCHGSFEGSVSPKGTRFPSNNKHTMHRGSAYMDTDCGLCHASGSYENPRIGSSAGSQGIPGYGCAGCHGRDYGGSIGVQGIGLRARHAARGVTSCAGCHQHDPDPLPEDVHPPYYGTVGTRVDDSCNGQPNHLENWSIGDTLGLDNDGDTRFDMDDTDCGGVRGDLNCDGAFNGADIDPFFLALGDPAAYAIAFPECDLTLGDMNGDGVLNGADIDPFFECLGAGGCP